jgi:tRNA-dihydrouridine synthase C
MSPAAEACVNVPPVAPPRLLLAPMEGLLDARLRAVVTRAAHYDWCVTEFVRVTDSVLPSRSYQRVAPELKTGSRTASGVPVRVQLLGSDPAQLADNADQLARLSPAGIDLNFGCPAPTVNRHRGGAVLLDEPELLHDIVGAVGRAVAGRVPFTAKMRLGVRDTSRAIEAAQALAEGGAEMIVVHARTKVDGYKPPAHWPWIARIAEAVRVPVVANGEIWSVDDYLRCRSESGLADVMIGRGAVADPLLVERIRARLRGEEATDPAADWPRIAPLLGDYWLRVLAHVEARHAAGRLKQWLNLLRRSYPQAEALYQAMRPVRDNQRIGELLAAALPPQAEVPVSRASEVAAA